MSRLPSPPLFSPLLRRAVDAGPATPSLLAPRVGAGNQWSTVEDDGSAADRVCYRRARLPARHGRGFGAETTVDVGAR